MSIVAARPATSKPRGPCRYFKTERGCYNGKACKFLHESNHSPYDLNKQCRFFAAGFCRRGDECWFVHDKDSSSGIQEEDDLCSICFERPTTYGLLMGCQHVFCISCIRQWRSNTNVDVVESGNTRRCPMCRTPTRFIIPSSKFFAHGTPDKDDCVARYRDSMRRTPCKHFQHSLIAHHKPHCPFGKECFYQHLNADGSEYVGSYSGHTLRGGSTDGLFSAGFSRPELIRSLESVFAETARLGTDARIMQQLDLLADQMLTSLALTPTDQSLETIDLDTLFSRHVVPNVEPVRIVGGAENGDDDDDDEMPQLASVSNSSDSEGDYDEDEDDESVESGGEPGPAVRPFDLEFHPQNDPATPAEAATEPTAAEVAPTTPPGSPPPEPPFRTDGRGRVVSGSFIERMLGAFF
ncbi:hypothetical protein MKEN_01435700 [Mycena kentingensis (nom. inval.)]|nr:hypothetical protein MKEN_01435700 [Mycena kentingensis (nom. inval.)]